MNKLILLLAFVCSFCSFCEVQGQHSIAREWNELLLQSIREDFARPTVHARNLFHSSIAIYDAWAVYDENAEPYLLGKTINGYTSPFINSLPTSNVTADRDKAICYAMYRLLEHRFSNNSNMLGEYDNLMAERGYSTTDVSLDYSTGNAAALGNYIASQLINLGLQDGSNEAFNFQNQFYNPVNPSLVMDFFGNPDLVDFNRWQPLTLTVFIDQSGNVYLLNTPEFLSPEWGKVAPFAIQDEDMVVYERDGESYPVCLDPGAPPQIDIVNGGAQTEEYQWNFALVSTWSSHLDANDATMWDISPNNIGNIQNYPTDFEGMQAFYDLENGGDASAGHAINPHTGLPYAPQMVKRADYARVLAEFWADGPDSETPPGHWFTILNYVSDHPLFEKRFEGQGPILDDLEWDVKSYFTLAGAMHDAAITAWGCKGWYDYIRPVSAIRGMAELGQSSDPSLPSYHIGGLPLIPNYIELVNAGDPLAGTTNQNVGKVKIKAWKGPDYIGNPNTTQAGVDWILAAEWWPYQRPSFVTPNFAGYVSGHSTFSRAAAEIMTAITGDAYFPGGMGEFVAPQNEFLVFEDGPSTDIVLQWATYRDASDQCSLSRIWGGIHPPADDMPGRLMGMQIGTDAFQFAKNHFNPNACSLEIPLQAGWNMISSNCYPSSMNMTEVFAGIEDNILQVKDLSGTFIPSFDFNGIGDWSMQKSYQVKVATADTLEITNGVKIDLTQTPIELNSGWNELAYLLTEDTDPFETFAEIASEVVQVKSLEGSYIPSFNFSDLGDLKQGDGYQIKMSSDQVFYYGNNGNLGMPIENESVDLKSKPKHFEPTIGVNPFSATLLLIDEENILAEGDEIGLFNQKGLLVGAGLYNNGKVGILLYGDDPDTPEIDGFTEGEIYKAKAFKSSTGRDYQLNLSFIKGDESFSIGKLSVATFEGFETVHTGIGTIPNEKIRVYPNPTASTIKFECNLGEVGELAIKIYDSNGRTIDELTERENEDGNYSINYNVEHLLPGVYQYQLAINNRRKTGQFAVMP